MLYEAMIQALSDFIKRQGVVVAAMGFLFFVNWMLTEDRVKELKGQLNHAYQQVDQYAEALNDVRSAVAQCERDNARLVTELAFLKKEIVNLKHKKR